MKICYFVKLHKIRMLLLSRRNIFLLNFTIGIFIILFVLLRLHNTGVINLRLRKTNIPQITTKNAKMTPEPAEKIPLRIPWRFHIEEDGFIFPPSDDKERYVTYERLNGSWIKQLLQFENANIFAYLLKRTLLVPPLFPFKSTVNNGTKTSEEDTFYMSEVIDFDLLSSMTKLGEIDAAQVEKIKLMKRYNVCHDPRLGFWLDYIPSVENIQTWRLLKQQYFSPLKLNLIDSLEKQYVCPGTENYIDRWGPPLHVKALYRGILTELYKRKEDLIYFQGDTLDTSHIRFFNKQRAQKAQELLLFYIRFSKKITKSTKKLARLLGYGYIAVLANHVVGNQNHDSITSYIANEAERHSVKNASRNVFIVSNYNDRHLFSKLQSLGFNLKYADTFIKQNIPQTDLTFLGDKIHLFSLLLCAYATKFIGLPGTSDLYFVEHLRLQDTTLVDGLVTDKVSVRWAKHTTRDKADERKVLVKTTKDTTLTKQIKINISIADIRVKFEQTKRKVTIRSRSPKRIDRLSIIACSFCNYLKYVTGSHGCPSMKHLC